VTANDQPLSKYVRAVLDGLGEAWTDSTGQAEPSDDQLIALLPESDETNRLAMAGYAYRVARKLSDKYPGAAILLLGAALDSIGSAPRTELREQVRRVRGLLKEKSLTDDPDVVAVLDAAQTLSNFDKVTQKMKAEFSQGLRASGDYQEDEIDDLTEEIVDVTHAVRHKGLIQRFFISRRESPEASGTIVLIDQPETQSSSDASFMYEADEYEIVEDRFATLINPARIACAHQISLRLRNRMNDQAGE
jgi:hypothetical protein